MPRFRCNANGGSEPYPVYAFQAHPVSDSDEPDASSRTACTADPQPITMDVSNVCAAEVPSQKGLHHQSVGPETSKAASRLQFFSLFQLETCFLIIETPSSDDIEH